MSGGIWLTSDGAARVCNGALLVSTDPCAAVCGGGCPGGQCCTITTGGAYDIRFDWAFPADAYIGQDRQDTNCNSRLRLYRYQIVVTGHVIATKRTVGTGAPANQTINVQYSAASAYGNQTCAGSVGYVAGSSIADSYGAIGNVTYDAGIGFGLQTESAYAHLQKTAIANAYPTPQEIFLWTIPFANVVNDLNNPRFSVYNTNTNGFPPRPILFGRNMLPSQGWPVWNVSIGSNPSSGSFVISGTNISTGSGGPGLTVYLDNVDIDVVYSVTPILEACDHVALLAMQNNRLASSGVSPELITARQSPDPRIAEAAEAQIRAMGIPCCGQ